MTDLVKTYSKLATAKGVAKKAGVSPAAIQFKGGQAAIITKPIYRSHKIDTPRPATAREFVWQTCNALLAQGLAYKPLRHRAIDLGLAAGHHLPQLQTEVSRWRHRFS